jgi:hypothetical protein
MRDAKLWEERFELEADAEASLECYQGRTITLPPPRHPVVLEIRSKRLLRKLAPGGVFARADLSNNAQSSHAAPPLPQPPPAKRAKRSHPQLDPQDPAVHFANQPARRTPRTVSIPTPEGTPSTSADMAPQVLPGSQLVEDRSCTTSGKLAREFKFRIWEQVASRMGLPDPYALSPRNIETLGEILVMANRRSAFLCIEQAKLRSIELGHTWTDNMHLAVEKIKRVSNRGIGPLEPLPRTQSQI